MVAPNTDAIGSIGFVDIGRDETVVTLHLYHRGADVLSVISTLSRMLAEIPGSTTLMMDTAGVGMAQAAALDRYTPERVRVRCP
jgi:hypothetical protein